MEKEQEKKVAKKTTTTKKKTKEQVKEELLETISKKLEQELEKCKKNYSEKIKELTNKIGCMEQELKELETDNEILVDRIVELKSRGFWARVFNK